MTSRESGINSASSGMAWERFTAEITRSASALLMVTGNAACSRGFPAWVTSKEASRNACLTVPLPVSGPKYG